MLVIEYSVVKISCLVTTEESVDHDQMTVWTFSQKVPIDV